MHTVVHWSHCRKAPHAQRPIVPAHGGWYALLEFIGEEDDRVQALDLVEATLRNHPPTDDPMSVRGCLNQANTTLYAANSGPGSIRNAQVSATMVAVSGSHAAVGHVGRLGATVLRAGAQEGRPCTTSHTAIDERAEVGQASDVGRTTSAERFVLTRALGALPKVDPHVVSLDVDAGDRLVLHSHGRMHIRRRDGEDSASLARRWASSLATSSREEATVLVVDCRMPAAGRDLLRKHPLARHFGSPAWDWLCDLGTVRQLGAGETLWEKNADVPGAVAILEGALRSEGSDCTTVAGQSTVLFVDALLHAHRTQREITALDDVSVLVIGRRALQAQLTRSPMHAAKAMMRLRSLPGRASEGSG